LAEVPGLLLAICLLGAVLAPITVLGWQFFHYLQIGIWQAISILDIMYWVDFRTDWIVNPQSWIGLHEVFGWLHGSILISLAFMAVAYVLSQFIEGMNEEEDGL